MTKRHILFAGCAWVAALAGLSSARADDAFLHIAVPPELIAYVETQTGYRLSPGVTIGVVDNGDELLATHNIAAPNISTDADAAESGGQIYMPTHNAVRLREPRIQAVIVHELTHVAQESNGKLYACNGQREAEAYTLQNKFLAEAGLPPAQNTQIILQMRQCMIALNDAR